MPESDEKVVRYHVYPLSKVHQQSEYCWCEPEMIYKDPDTGKEVWVHKEIQ